MKLFGVLGYPVEHSASPAMMNRAFQVQSVNAAYHPFLVAPEDLETALNGLRAICAVGVNVTIPHKFGAFEWVHEHTQEALQVGVVNTIRFDGDSVVGHNTDVSGWWRSVSAHVPQGRVEVAMLGAGGAAMAIVAALAANRPHSRIVVAARRESAVAVLQRRFENATEIEFVPWEHRHDAVMNAQLVIQTTPIGMWPNSDVSPIDDANVFSPRQIVQDIVYRPRLTRFSKMASDRGATVIEGLSMLVYQGVDAYEWWLLRTAPVSDMFEAVTEHLRLERSSS